MQDERFDHEVNMDARARVESARRHGSFRKELEGVLNKCSMECGSDTPDFVLAAYLSRCLRAFDEAVISREKWYSRECGGGRAISGGREINEESES